jgi:predicted lipoprotein with Yx(FWY)xxD motif
MREGVRAACVLAAGFGLLTGGCGGEHRAGPASGGFAQPSSAAPESSSPSTEVPSPPSATASAEPPPTEGPAPSGPGPMEIRSKETRYGRILVDGQDMTIYVAEKDNADFESTCTGPCMKVWPPLFTNGQVTAGPGVNSAWLGTIGRSDGLTQVEYNGWPLYHYARDAAPGDVKGQGVTAFGTRWYVLDADKGQKVK